ncbi:unnamed protein product [Chrysodeixis includens]|uniref:Death-inducer obliterator 1 n=1 Tax=Chrysodeixis includens TaxID=689277 RepID=A0A9P0FV72_CHRIL|nr:unnamed protein product [Chrysodeixis includens]
MSNTVITNYTDLNGPSTKADSSVVVIVNKDGSLSVDQKLLGTLMGTDGSQSAGISVVRVGHEGKPDDATDSETDDEKVPHVTLSVDSYYDEPNSIIKYDSGAEMLQSLRIETRENSLVGFQNDHCYTPLKSPSQTVPQKSDNLPNYDESVIEITHTPPPKPVPNSKKITILEQKILPKGKKIVINPSEAPVILKGNDVLHKPLPVTTSNKSKDNRESEKSTEASQKADDSTESSSISSSGDSIPDRDSDSDYKYTKDRTGSVRVKKLKSKPRILKSGGNAKSKLESKLITKLKPARNIIKKENNEKIQNKNVTEKKDGSEVDLESLLPSSKISTVIPPTNDLSKVVLKQTPKPAKKEKKTPSHVTALLSDMTSLFSTPDVIRRVSTDGKVPPKTPTSDKDSLQPSIDKKPATVTKVPDPNDVKVAESKVEDTDSPKPVVHKTYVKSKDKVVQPEKPSKPYDPIPQLDDASLAQILQDTTGISNPVKGQPTISTAGAMNSPGLAGPLSPTLDLLGGLQPEEEGLTEDFLMSVAQLVASSENLQEVIDKQVLGKEDTAPAKTQQKVQTPQTPQTQPSILYTQALSKSAPKTAVTVRKDPIEIVRRDGRVITLPPIEAPATRSSKRKTQTEITPQPEAVQPAAVVAPAPATPVQPVSVTPEPQVQAVSKQYINKKLTTKKQEQATPIVDKAESQESWNSEDDPNRLWCICKQPHNNRFMICCDGCEDWFHGKCVNITKAMGQQMEEQGIEWRCPNCIKKAKPNSKNSNKVPAQIRSENDQEGAVAVKSPVQSSIKDSLKTSCIVCKKPARASSIYCSNSCIWKHAQDSLGNQGPSGKGDGEPGKSNEKQKAESRVIVYERKSGRLLAGPNAPTAENLKAWLQQNPTFEVVRPGTLSTIKPAVGKKKTSEPTKIQTTLNFERIPRKSAEQLASSKTPPADSKERSIRLIPAHKEESKTPQLKTPATPKSQPTTQLTDTPKASTSSAKPGITSRKLIRTPSNQGQSSQDKAPSVSPSTSRRKDSTHTRMRMSGGEPIRDNVRKALQEQLAVRMSENKGQKFSEDEIQQFANDTEQELHELFRDVGMKYKAKYRSLMFNIKDRKNLTLWEKICDRSITPKQLVRLSPEELASQELAQWRDKEAKHQLELIKKSELDLLAANKTYVLKTHKGEEVMETKESVSTELDPNVPVEDVVTALNDSTVGPDVLTKEKTPESTSKPDIEEKKYSSKKRNREDSSSGRSKRSRRDSKRDSDRKSRSSKRRSESKEKESREEQRRSTRRSEKKSTRTRSSSKERSKDKPDTNERSRHRSASREKTKRRSKSPVRERSRSRARRRSSSRDTRRRNRSRSKRTISSDDKLKNRSRSQDNAYKTKNDSTDSDSIERPKSAMLKEAHPEYDPHEPMITSAFSEEDLRKSREDVFEENYRNDMSNFEAEFDPSKTLIDTNLILPATRYSAKQDKTSEAESDQEPSSTVDNAAATVWSGCINMVDVARFYVAAYEVSGSSVDLEEDLSTELDIVGRINPDTVWDYIAKMKKTSNKDIVILKLQTANDEEKMQYIALYSYLSSRNRLGVVKASNMMTVKDFYIVPLPANTTLPAVLLPLDGPGIGEIKTHLLIAIVIRQRKKRLAANIPTDVIPAKVARESRKRSYTPPASPRRRPPLPLLAYTSSTLSTTVKDKIAASLVSADDDEPYSPGSTSSSGSGQASGPSLTSNTLRSKMEELNRQIEEQKQQIMKMAQADSSIGEDEAYSPSRPMTPPPVQSVPLADIALPSNLQEILATIKQRSETSAGDVDMRTLPLP